MTMKKYHKVIFLPENTTISVEDRITIFETILENNPQNIALHFDCGAEGICRKCKIRAFQKMGPLTPTEKGCLSEKELIKGIRLACQARVIQDTTVEIIYKLPFSIQLVDEPVSGGVDMKQRVEKLHIRAHETATLSPESFMASVSAHYSAGTDLEILAHAVQTKFACFFHEHPQECTAVFIEGELVCLEQGNTMDRKFAAAVDLGTNTLVVSLVNLNERKKIAVVTDTNPQIELGEDFESRINMVAENPLNLEILNEEIILRMDMLILELCRAVHISPLHVYEIIVSGGTGMLHLFLKGVSDSMEQQAFAGKGRAAAFSSGQFDLKSSQSARVYTLPVISSYVGADITAGIVATQLHRSQETVLFLDLGTSAKGVLHHKGKITTTSVSDCGAFECAGVQCGMRPETGAITRVALNKEIQVDIIGESLARGICGSGLMELTAELKREGILDAQGDFQEGNSLGSITPQILNCIVDIKGKKSFRLYTDEGEFQTDVYVTQEDIYLLRKAKAATVAMVKKLIEYMEVTFRDISAVLIGGAFGNSIDINTFFELGFIPSLLQEKVFFVGNTSKKGSQMALIDKNILPEAEKIVKDIVCIPPVTNDFPVEDLNFSVWLL